MLSGEGNAGERWETTRGLISKKATLHVQHTFFVRFFAVALHDYNVKLSQTSQTFTRCLGEMSYVLQFTYFSLPLIFTLHFSFCHCRYKIFMLSFQQKNVSFVFYLSLQISVALFLVELRRPAAYFPFFSVFLLLYFPNLWS